ncbi:MAG: MmgE/PrpD family protein [Firmicutes bacterium]|nr:MmgE/PrpD family protein [Bacillota bacterium]MBR0115182.1 MmgE/PrpD family protein [Bacillota bacterium]
MSENNIQYTSVSDRMADFALKLKLSDVPPEVIEHGKMLLADTFGVALSCQDLPHAKAVAKAIEEMGVSAQCTMWAGGRKASLADAVLYNSCLIHGADYDDTHVSSIVHPSAAVVAAAMTAGELTGADGEEMFCAMVAGWEIVVRLGLAAEGIFHDVGYHGTAIVAPFAAACVMGKLLKLPKEVIVNALGICGSQAAGLQEFLHDGSWVKKIHPGWGCHSAAYALMMAKNGFLGPLKVLEGGFGLYQTHVGKTDAIEHVMDDLGEKWLTCDITFKMYPVCHMAHSFIDCVKRIVRSNSLKPDDIKDVECRIETRCYGIICSPDEVKKRPQNDYMMRFSLPYVVAAAIIKGNVSPWEIDPKYASEPEMMAMMDKVTCIDDESKRNPGHFPGWVKITLNDGRVFTEDQRFELGSEDNPVKFSDVMDKFSANLSALYSKDQIDRLSQLIKGFDGLPSAAPLLEAMRV